MDVTYNLDPILVEEFLEVCKKINMKPADAITLFMRTMVRDGALPFSLSFDCADGACSYLE